MVNNNSLISNVHQVTKLQGIFWALSQPRPPFNGKVLPTSKRSEGREGDDGEEHHDDAEEPLHQVGGLDDVGTHALSEELIS